jgi:hypothetical protein
METVSMREACSFCGYLEKKSPSMFGGWQKRYFKILEGKVLTYSEKEKDKEFKGSINLEDVSGLVPTEKKW